MATYTLNAGDRAANNKTQTAATVDTVQFAEWVPEIEVTSLDGADDLYFTVDGSTPTDGGATTYVLPASVSSRTVKCPQIMQANSVRPAATAVKLIAGGTPKWSVSRT